MGHQRGVVGVVGLEVVLEAVALGAGHEVQAVHRHVVHDDRFGAETGRQPQGLEEVEPLGVAFGLVVPDDGEDGDVGLAQSLQYLDGAHDVAQVRLPVVEQVAGVDHGVDVVGHRVLGDLSEGIEEVLAAGGGVVLAIPEVGVPGVYHPCHLPRGWPPLHKGIPRPGRKWSRYSMSSV